MAPKSKTTTRRTTTKSNNLRETSAQGPLSSSWLQAELYDPWPRLGSGDSSGQLQGCYLETQLEPQNLGTGNMQA